MGFIESNKEMKRAFFQKNVNFLWKYFINNFFSIGVHFFSTIVTTATGCHYTDIEFFRLALKKPSNFLTTKMHFYRLQSTYLRGLKSIVRLICTTKY